MKPWVLKSYSDVWVLSKLMSNVFSNTIIVNQLLHRLEKKHCHPLCSLVHRFGKRDPGGDEVVVFPKRMLGRVAKRNEETTRILGRMTKEENFPT